MGDEIGAMGKIAEALKDLEPDEARRVLAWAVTYGNEKLGANLAAAGPGTDWSGGDPDGADDGVPKRFERIGDLMDAASPSDGPEYVLLGTYWFQEILGAENVTGQQVNDQLKDLGHGIANITTTFERLKDRKPPLARQVQKSGSSRQARKRYRLTQEGTRQVEKMLADG